MDNKVKYYLEIADNAFILSHRLSECSSRGPFLEEDLAATNVALDLIGLAEAFYNEAAKILNDGTTGDDLAYRRAESEYYNVLLTEQPNTDFAHVMVRQFLMDAFHYYFFTEALSSSDSFIKAMGSKTLKEVTYHLKRSSEWILRFGGGTELSKAKAQDAVNALCRYKNELWEYSEAGEAMLKEGVAIDLEKVCSNWKQKVSEVFYLANIKRPENDFQLKGGKSGNHSEHMGYMLSEIQFLTNKYPEAIW